VLFLIKNDKYTTTTAIGRKGFKKNVRTCQKWRRIFKNL